MMRRAVLLVALGLVAACAATERAAHEDPMKCERDPKCDKKRGRTQDCSMQCSDDPACVERCEQVQSTTKLGH
ncbi:MAG: hypothetical protein U0270_42700 [Labilithrix sp.]